MERTECEHVEMYITESEMKYDDGKAIKSVEVMRIDPTEIICRNFSRELNYN